MGCPGSRGPRGAPRRRRADGSARGGSSPTSRAPSAPRSAARFAASGGESGVAPWLITTPASARPRLARASSVSRVWLIVPRRAARHDEQRQRRARRARSAMRDAAGERARAGRRRLRPAGSRGARAGARRRRGSAPRSTARPSAARGDGGRRREREALRADVLERVLRPPAASRSASASSGPAGPDAGLDRLHARRRRPRARAAPAASAQATSGLADAGVGAGDEERRPGAAS